LLATDERHHACAVQGLEAAFFRALTYDTESTLGLVEPPYLLIAQILDFEDAAEEPMRVFHSRGISFRYVLAALSAANRRSPRITSRAGFRRKTL
jgi:hypothetical protein